nr:restriction endonuclease subunit S [Cerasicoccus arenae]
MPATPPPKGWKWSKLTDLARLESGHTPSRKYHEYWDGGVCWVGIRDATANHGQTIYDTNQHASELGIKNSSARLLPKNTVCLSRTASVGYVIVMGKEMATSQDFVNWVCSEELDHQFLKYILLSENRSFLRFASGTTHQTIYFPEVKAFHICHPPLPEQRAISHILGSLDDKIELNRRMNATLEGMAQALFKSWFVDFDPVIDNALAAGNPIPDELADRAEVRRQALANGTANREAAKPFPAAFQQTESMGWIPEGWEISCFGEVSTCFDRKRIPLSKPQREVKKPGKIPYYGATSIMDYVNEWIFDDTYLLIGEDGSVIKDDGTPFVQYIWGKSWVNNHAHVLQGKDGISTEHLMLFMQSQNLAGYVTGAVQLKINQKNMNSIPFLKARDSVNLQFSEAVTRLYERIKLLSEENVTLINLRDTLLPKLISGELRLSDTAVKAYELTA